MHFHILARFIGILVIFLGISMIPSLLLSYLYEDGETKGLLVSAMVTFTSGLVLFLLSRKKDDNHLNHKDGVAIVTFGWVAAALFGALPYLLTGAISDLTNAFFESMSGFTTTGASILSDIESIPKEILFWRSLTQWFGGMGIIVLSIAILPFLGVGGMQLYKAEIPSPVVDKLKPRISETAKVLWKVYILITAAEVVLLLFGGMSLFDAVCHAFCTMPTGGFSTKNASIAHFPSLYIHVVIVVFMLLAGINFSLHYKLLAGDRGAFWRDSEFKVFIALVFIFSTLIVLDTYNTVFTSLGEAVRHGIFQVASIITTTGFVTADFDQWPALSRHILLGCMFIGAMAGSTGGGMKVMRTMLLVKHGYREIFRIIHPHAVTVVKLGGTPIPDEVLRGIWGFFILFIGLFVMATLAMASLGLDLISSFASVAASMGNIGPGLGLVGPVKNYAAVPTAGKWILIFCMLLGRLEIYTVIVLLTPEFWRK